MGVVRVGRSGHGVDVPGDLPEGLQSAVLLVLNHVDKIAACREHLNGMRVALEDC